ncbi:transmembrane protein 214 isoform X1 [Microcaecilia unicolor]|uniref:Transmembrane protein 214 isoform X1 n=1 Tax=Microcaecilia unicolor TaxID=1415580 RepID=A0A6P7XPL4_9AMPH|nr:transmembrane protein 214 isoform X1 [Microcaecilia unicolor]
MASAPGKWEVVKKSKKPGGGGGSGSGAGKKGGAAGRKALGEANLPRIVPAPLIKPCATIFELGFEKPTKKQNKEQVPPVLAPEQQPQQKKQNAGKQAKKLSAGDVVPKQGRFRSLEDALKALDLSDLQKELEKSQNMFPENPSVWLKDLAGYLNFKLQAPRSDPTLSQYTHDYPYSLVSRELKVIIKALLEKSSGVLELFFDHCIYIMLQELDKPSGESLHGYRICVQAVLLERPKIATMNVGKYLELLRSQQSRPMKCLTVMWALGQAGFTDLIEGLKVWLGIMLPVLGIKSLSPYAIAYLDRLLMMHSNLTKGFGMIGPKDFFPLLDFAFMPNNSLSPSLQDQLQQLYPRLKVLAFGAKPETTLHTYFPSFLSRATPHCPPDMKKELLTCMNECLNMDPLSFSVWRQLYTKHLSQSSLLLNHILDSWDNTSKKMRKSLRETVHSFKVTNEEFSLKGTNNAQDIESCDITCKTLLHKMKGRGIPWSRLLLVVLVFTAGFIIHDIRAHGSFQASSSAHILQHSGLLTVSQQAWNKVSYFILEGCSWIERNAPIYYSHMMRILGPNLELAWSKTKEATAYISHLCSSQIAWVRDNLPWFIEWLQSSIPDSVVEFIEYLKELLLFLYQKYLLPTLESLNNILETTWKQIENSCNGEVSWDCLKRHLASITYASWIYLQNTTLAVKNWALAIISRH